MTVFESKTKICVIGMGYVGIPVAALLAEVDTFEVFGLQRKSIRSGWKIEVLNSGKSPFEGTEPGLDELISKVAKKGSFKVTDDPSILNDADYILIDVQTPTDGPNRQPQYNSLRSVCESIGNHLKKRDPKTTIIVESTVAPGTTENIVRPIIEETSGLKAGDDFYLAFSYERVMPGRLIEFIVNMPRVIGGTDPEGAEKARWLYSHIVTKELSVTDCTTAELAKTIENAYRDVNIAFANEMAVICESMGSNVFEIRELINKRHDRNMHIPGAGVGGHCLPKDSWLLRFGVQTYGTRTMEPEFIALARRINDHMPDHISSIACRLLAAEKISIINAKVAVLGAAYLENSDDTRNTPTYMVISSLQGRGVKNIVVHDPYVRQDEFDSEVTLTRNFEEAVKDADVIILITKHKEYITMDFETLTPLVNHPIFVDGRNIFEKKDVEAKGWKYAATGKGN
ncbi:MAG: nucleotide sugar dehydrogenase [Candidatus Kariarchaeaceae archaeon]